MSSSSDVEEEQPNDGRQKDYTEESQLLKERLLSSSASSITSLTSSEGDGSGGGGEKSWMKKKKKLSKKLSTIKRSVSEKSNRCEELEKKLAEETDAKERVEGYLKELQQKHREALSTIESLNSRLNTTEEHCLVLTASIRDLGGEVPEIVVHKASERLHQDDHGEDNEETEEHEASLNEDQSNVGKTDIPPSDSELQIVSLKLLIATYVKQIDQLDKQHSEMKAKVETLEKQNEVAREDYEDLEEEERRRLVPIIERQVKKRLENVENCLVDQSQLGSQNHLLEGDVKTLQNDLQDYQKKYAEAIVTLKEVQDTLEMRDEVLENYKEENEHLKTELKNMEQEKNPNESVITGLRQEILEARLSLERCKKSHQEELDERQKQYDILQQSVKATVERNETLCREIDDLKKSIQTKDELLVTAENLSNERLSILNTMRSEMVSQKDSVARLNQSLDEKTEEIEELHKESEKQIQILDEEKEEIEKLQERLSEIDELKDENRNCYDEIEELKSKVKVKKMKVKFLKKQVKETTEQKEKLDSIVFVIPEMQKKLDQSEAEKLSLQEELDERIRQEEEQLMKMEQDRLEQEERVQRERENWERRLLGIGECSLHHHEGVENCTSSHVFHRPNSAPTMKPRPPSARRYQTSSGQNKHNRARTTPSGRALHPKYLHEGRSSSPKVHVSKQRIIMTGGGEGNGKNRERLFRSVTMPADFASNYTHVLSENKFFPNLRGSKKNIPATDYNGNNISPRVLVWGSNEEDENAGKKLVAVGDRVSANINTDCNVHGTATVQNTGMVKFIGFVEGNKKDVYIGLRMDDTVGNTNGSVNGKRYFRCEQNRGKFIRLEDVKQILETQTIHHAT
eukprot:TCONS_00011540-protein